MDMENIERFRLENFQHLDREREGIRGVVKQRIGNHRCLVKVDSRVVGFHPDGRGVGDEIDVVAARGELLAKLRGDDPRATVGRVSGNANTHRAPIEVILRNLGRVPCLRVGKG